jgi:hypothetical protein
MLSGKETGNLLDLWMNATVQAIFFKKSLSRSLIALIVLSTRLLAAYEPFSSGLHFQDAILILF